MFVAPAEPHVLSAMPLPLRASSSIKALPFITITVVITNSQKQKQRCAKKSSDLRHQTSDIIHQTSYIRHHTSVSSVF